MTAWAVAYALKASGVLGLALLAVTVLRRRSAASRHWVLVAAVLCVSVLPVAMLTSPAWSPGFETFLRESEETGNTGNAAVAEVSVATPDTAIRRSPQAPGFPVRGPASDTTNSVASILVGIWAAGFFASLLGLALGFVRLQHLTQHAGAVVEASWLRAAEEIGREYRLGRQVRLLAGRSSSTLVAWGWRRPTVLIPADADAWTTDRIGVVLSHELGHLARGDWPVQLAAEAMRAVLWFDPLAWLTCRWLRRDSERACDDMVLARGYAADAYATELLAVARGLRSTHESWLPAPAMARSSSLEGRVEAMLNRTQDRTRSSWFFRVGVSVTLFVVALAVAGLQAQGPYFSVSGSVTDQTGAHLAGATLTLTNKADESKYEVRTDGTGHFAFVGVRGAGYQLDVKLPGFAVGREDLVVSGNLERHLRLKVGSLQETVTVRDQQAPAPSPDPTMQQRLEESRRRFAEKSEREQALCDAGAGALKPGTIFPPVKIQDVRPEYPEHLKAAKTGGVVTLDARIGLDGSVREVTNVQGPHPDLEAAAARAVSQWRFSSTRLNCQPIEVEMRVVTNFALAQ